MRIVGKIVTLMIFLAVANLLAYIGRGTVEYWIALFALIGTIDTAIDFMAERKQ